VHVGFHAEDRKERSKDEDAWDKEVPS